MDFEFNFTFDWRSFLGGLGVGMACATYAVVKASRVAAKNERRIQLQAETIRKLKSFVFDIKSWKTIDKEMIDKHLTAIREREDAFLGITWMQE